MLTAAPRDLQGLRREHQEASREERHHGEHVEVHAVGARGIAARLLERLHRSHVNAGRQQGGDAQPHCLAVGPALQAHIEAVQLAEALEPPLRGGDVGQRLDAFEVHDPADLQLDCPVPDDQPQPIAFRELGSGRREEDLVGRQQLRPPLAQRIDADQPDGPLGPRQPGVELQAGAHRGDAGEPGDGRIERLRKSAAPAPYFQVRLAGEAAHRRGELVHRGAVDQVHAVAERDTEGDAEDREQRPPARAMGAEQQQAQHAAHYNHGSSGLRQRDILR